MGYIDFIQTLKFPLTSACRKQINLSINTEWSYIDGYFEAEICTKKLSA